MGFSEYRRMRNLEKEATDIRKTLRDDRSSASDANYRMRYERDEYGRKVYKVKGKKTEPTLTVAQRRALENKAKAAEKELKKREAEAKKQQKAAKKQPRTSQSGHTQPRK